MIEFPAALRRKKHYLLAKLRTQSTADPERNLNTMPEVFFTIELPDVRARFGFYCSSASAQLADIERWTLEHPNNATIRIIQI
jgi:hypothetical protein